MLCLDLIESGAEAGVRALLEQTLAEMLRLDTAGPAFGFGETSCHVIDGCLVMIDPDASAERPLQKRVKALLTSGDTPILTEAVSDRIATALNQIGPLSDAPGFSEWDDYRYFPDPDLLPLELDGEWVNEIARSLPELPDEKKARFIEKLGLSPYDASVLVAEKESADFYEKVAKGRDGKLAANWVITEYFGVLNKSGQSMDEFTITAEKLGGLIDLISDNTISNRLAKDVFALMVETGKDAATIVEEKGMKQVTDTGAIEKVIDEVMAANADKVAEYRSGKDKLFGFFVGQTMKASGGKANHGWHEP